MCMKVSFSVKYSNCIPNGKTIITKDMSILFEPAVSIDSFSVYPYHWSFELTTAKQSQTQYLIRYGMGSMCLLNCEHMDLTIPKAQKGEVYVDFSCPPRADGVYYNKFSKFIPRKYYDAKKRIFAIGDIKAYHGNCIEIASGQFVLINDMRELVAVYVRLD